MRQNLQVVLHQIRSPDNLGAVARLMANFGFTRLSLSDPLTYDVRAAEKMAVRGKAVLEQLSVHRTLDEALAPCVYACGTTSRQALKGRATLTPEGAALRLRLEAQRGPVALVFGGEKRGLSDDELARCQDVLVIPTASEQPSMNLAQAAAVLLYLCARAEEPPRPAEAAPEAEPAATLGALRALEERARGLLLTAGFLNPQAPESILRELTRPLGRAGLTQREVELWLGAFKKLAWWGRREA